MASKYGWGGVGPSVVADSDDDSSGTTGTAATTPSPSPFTVKTHAVSDSTSKETPSWATPIAAAKQPKQSQEPSTSDGKGKGKASAASSDAATPEAAAAASAGGKLPSQEGIRVRMDDLARREQAVRQREDHVKELEGRLKEGGIEVKPKNWPRCKPILYHDIQAEVPTPLQPLCKAGYVLWMLSISAYLFNFIAVTIMFFMGTGTLACWFFAALATVIGIFCSWWTVYSNLYRAVQTVGGTWAYGKYMIHQAIFVVWTVWVVIAPPIGTSSCFVAGVFVMIDQFSGGGTKGATGGILGIINIAIWGLVSFLAIYVLLWAFRIWRRGGGLEELQQQQRQMSNNVSTAAKLFGAN